MTTPVLRDAIRIVADAGVDPAEMQWFDISGADRTDVLPTTDWLMQYRPPFEKCMVCFRGPTANHANYEMWLMMSGSDPHEGIALSMRKGPVGQRLRALPEMVYLIEDDLIKYGPLDDTKPLKEEEARLILGIVIVLYRQLSTGCQTYKPEIQQTFTNRRKIAAGKTPTYDWKTVVIGPKQPKSEHKGGTHASPRRHDRRGHLRTFKNGKSIWVKPHKVGNAALGSVFHDYVVQA